MEIKYYDTHAHINIEPLDGEIEQIINDCLNNNTILNCIGVDIPTSLSAIELSKKYPNVVRACVGIHPDDGVKAIDDENQMLNELEDIIKNNLDNIVCVGEIGLDYYDQNITVADKEKQKRIFIKQIELAIKYQLPINIHNRNADDDLINILDQFKLNKVMIHCFSSNTFNAKRFIERNYFLSIPGIVTFKNAKDLHEAIKEIPVDKIVVETDAPFLTPVPFRGKTNYPHYVKYTLDEIAKIKNIDNEKLRIQILNNSINFFNKG